MPPSVATRIASLKASVETPRSAATCRLGTMTQLGPIELCRRALTASRRASSTRPEAKAPRLPYRQQRGEGRHICDENESSARMNIHSRSLCRKWLSRRSSRVFGLGGRRAAEQIGDPSGRRMAFAEGERSDDDRHADEGAEQTPEKGPEEHREQNDRRRNREHVPRDARLNVTVRSTTLPEPIRQDEATRIVGPK